MVIRRAKTEDAQEILDLLKQVNLVHHNYRPDIFNVGTKYTPAELHGIILNDDRPILVAEEDGKILGYAFCVFQQTKNDNILTDIKTLYLDDLCVDEHCRGQHIGQALYQAVLDLAKVAGCYHLTLNVWWANQGALRFYEKCGMEPLKIYMEKIIE